MRLEYTEKALKIMEQLNYIHEDMALAHRILSDCADADEQRLVHALTALKMYHLQTPWDQNNIYRSMLRIAEINRRLGRNAVAKEYFQNAASLLETILPPDHPKLTKLYEEINNIEEDHND